MTLIRFVFLLCWVAAALSAADTSAPVPSEESAVYVLGPEDQVTVQVLEIEEFPGKPTRVDPNGYLELPLVGRVKAAGLTTGQLTEVITGGLRKYVRDPRVSINVTEYRSQTVSVLGAVNTPGVQPLQGPKRLLEMLSQAGGLRPEAGSKLTLTRQSAWGTLNLPNARADVSGQFSTAELDLERLMKGTAPAENIHVRPHDVIAVSRADVIYVIGEVKKSGGFPLHTRESVSLLQALALAEGLQRTAAPKHARILRSNNHDGKRQEVAVNLQDILDGKAPDMPLQADDVLFVPNNLPRSVMMRTAETALQIGTGVLIWRR